MALRVLLADNSEAIKKVIQLSLQDFAAEVRSVSVGIDVIAVAKQFKPDIIFADILLQKRSGYEVCLDIKQDPELGSIPVILMWSGFMEMDHKKMQDSRADGTLEKPFESNDLRELVKKFVPKLATNPMADFLDIPGFSKKDIPVPPPPAATPPPPPPPPAAPVKAAAIPAAIPTTSAAPSAPTPPPVTVAAPQPPASSAAPAFSAPAPQPPAPETGSGEDKTKSWDMSSFDDINEFEMKEMAKSLPDLQSKESSADHEDFAQQPLNQVSKEMSKPLPSPPSGFELDVPDETDFDGVTVEFKVPDDVTNTDFLTKPPVPTAPTPPPAAQAAAPAPQVAAPVVQTPPPMSEEQLEELLKGHSREIIEKIVWKLIPDMAERIIRDEIKRLLDEPDMKA
jgi:CheY-like chemotaxis protein